MRLITWIKQDSLCYLLMVCFLGFLVGTPVRVMAEQLDREKPIVLCLTKSGLKYYVHPRDAMLVFDALVNEYMIPELGFSIRFKFYDDDKQMYRAIKNEKADIGCSHLVNFLKYYECGLVKPLVWFQQYRKNGKGSGDHYILVVRKSSDISSIEQLRGKTIGMGHVFDRNKIEYLYFKNNRNYREQDYFKKVKLFNNSRDAIYSLLFNATDVVFETEYSLEIFQKLRPELMEELMALPMSTETIADLPVFYRTSADKETMKKIKMIARFFITMHKDPGKKEILYFLGCDKTGEITEKQERAYKLWTKMYRQMKLISDYPE